MKALSNASAFDRAMGRRPVAKTPHFFLHHSPPQTGGASQHVPELSTGAGRAVENSVDDLSVAAAKSVPDGRVFDEHRLGLVVPKRHARRAVTRSLVRRQAKSVMASLAGGLSAGDWVLRLRLAFDPKLFPSAASDALRRAVRQELTELVQHASRRSPRRPSAAAAEA